MDIEEIIAKLITRSISKDELDTLSDWLKEPKNKAVFKELLRMNFALDYHIKEFNHSKNATDFLEEISPKRKEAHSTFPFKKFYKYAAILILAMSCTFTAIYLARISGNKPQILSENSPALLPSSNSAVLTLEDGKKINLNASQGTVAAHISNKEGTVSYQTKGKKLKQHYNYLTVPKGNQYKIRLADGSLVWLNADSKLKYPSGFVTGNDRVVELLYGEAYFDVAPSVLREGEKFIVKTKMQEVEVLGTEFNINAYESEDEIKTTLVEGSVDVSNASSQIRLYPGQQSIMGLLDEQIQIRPADLRKDIAWIKGLFIFDREKLEDIMKKVERWYDIQVVFTNETKRDLRFSGRLKRREKLNDLLLTIQDTGDATFEMTDNKTIYVK